MTTWVRIDNNAAVLADLTTTDPAGRFDPSLKWAVVPDALASDPVALQVGLALASDGVTLQIANPTAYAALHKSGLLAYANAKQTAALAAVFSHPLSDGSATLTTACDPASQAGLLMLKQWAADNATVTPAPSRLYINSDWSSHPITPTQMTEFGNAVGAHVSALWADLATVIAAITAGTLTTTAQIDGASWG